MSELINFIQAETINALTLISVNQGKDFDSDKASAFMSSTFANRVKSISAEAKSDYEQALFMGQAMAKTCFSVAMKHGCTMYAKDIFEHSVI